MRPTIMRMRMRRPLVLMFVDIRRALCANNSRALLPPMDGGWNCFYADISDAKIRSQIDALVKPRDSVGTTLYSLGYTSIGIDEGWEAWYDQTKHETHDPHGVPQVNTERFPNMEGLVNYGHAKGVQMGFYLNGCGANERVEKRINYEGDVKATLAWGFDGVKIDSCGAQKNMSLYCSLFNQTGKAIEVENCHQGRNITVWQPGANGRGMVPLFLPHLGRHRQPMGSGHVQSDDGRAVPLLPLLDTTGSERLPRRVAHALDTGHVSVLARRPRQDHPSP